MMLKNYTDSTRRHGSSVFWLNAVLIAGIALGSFFGNPYNISSPLVNQFFSPVYSGNTPVEVFSNTFMSLFFFVLTAFLSGMSAIGQPVGIILLLYRQDRDNGAVDMGTVFQFKLNGHFLVNFILVSHFSTSCSLVSAFPHFT